MRCGSRGNSLAVVTLAVQYLRVYGGGRMQNLGSPIRSIQQLVKPRCQANHISLSLSLGAFSGEHDRVRAIVHRICHVTDFGPAKRCAASSRKRQENE